MIRRILVTLVQNKRLLKTMLKYLESLYAEKVYETQDVRPDRSLNPLTAFPRKYWSQADEDGILEKIFDRLGPRVIDRVFLEIGVGDGLECNTIGLMARGWRGAWISGQPISFTPANGGRLLFKEAFLTLENLQPLFSEVMHELEAENPDFVSVDIDGNDYHFCGTLLSNGVRPSVWAVEYNARFPADADWIMPYQADFSWDGSDYFGAAIQSFQRLFEGFDYFPVACSSQGANVFFVSGQHKDLFQDVPTKLNQLYQPPTYQRSHRWGHPVSPQTIQQITEAKS